MIYSKPRIDDELLARYSRGIIATSACLGSRSSQLILKGRFKEAEYILRHHQELFNDKFLIELQLHHGEQQEVNRALVEIADTINAPLIVTNDCHYTDQADKPLHEILLAAQTRTTLSDPKRFSFGDIDVHFANSEWMAAKVKEFGLPEECISNTVHVAKHVTDDYFSDVKNHYPTFKGLPDGITSWDYLEQLANQKLSERYHGKVPHNYQERLNYELKVIKKMGFDNYMLIVMEMLDMARQREVWTGPGRGSVCASLVAYVLGITQVDPIRYNLIFERYLSEGRAATPLIFSPAMKEIIHAGQNHHHTAECRH